ncbi:MAG: MmcQ/YjbR family DNA-binding protein [Devosia sp.]
MVADGGTKAAVKRLLRLTKALDLAEVSEGTSYDQPALRVRDKRFVTVKDGRTIMLPCPLEMKEVLMEAAPAIFTRRTISRAGPDCWHGWT